MYVFFYLLIKTKNKSFSSLIRKMNSHISIVASASILLIGDPNVLILKIHVCVDKAHRKPTKKTTTTRTKVATTWTTRTHIWEDTAHRNLYSGYIQMSSCSYGCFLFEILHRWLMKMHRHDLKLKISKYPCHNNTALKKWTQPFFVLQHRLSGAKHLWHKVNDWTTLVFNKISL